MDTFVLLVRRIRAGVGARVSRRVVSRRDMTGSWRGLRWEGMTLVFVDDDQTCHALCVFSVRGGPKSALP